MRSDEDDVARRQRWRAGEGGHSDARPRAGAVRIPPQDAGVALVNELRARIGGRPRQVLGEATRLDRQGPRDQPTPAENGQRERHLIDARRLALLDHARELGIRHAAVTADGDYGSGRYLTPRAYGHTGFTGTCLWIDPGSRTFYIFLSSRLHETDRHSDHRKVYEKLGAAAARAVLGKK